MMDGYIPIAKVELSEAEIDAAVRVLRSGKLSQGRCTQEFEESFARKTNCAHAIAVSSGTAALHIAYLSALNEGDEVLVPAFSHISTASMAYFAKCRPVFCDIDPKTFTLSVEDAERRLTPKSRAIAPVHVFGNACDIRGIIDLARKHSLFVIWDAAQAHGTRYMGKDVGGYDDLVCYSFYPTKNMTTGEGGMITTNDDQLAEKCRLLRSHWQVSKYYHPGLGFNYRMTEVEAAVGLEQLAGLDHAIDKRRANASYLTNELAGIGGIATPFLRDDVEHSYHQYAILVEPDRLGSSRDEFAKILENRGIGTGIHYPRPLHKQPAFEKMFGQTCLPSSEDICERVLSLPVYPQLTDSELRRVAEMIEESARDLSARTSR